MDKDGHRNTWGYTKGFSWPMFGPNGEIIREQTHQALSEAHAKSCGVCRAQTEER